MTVRPNDNVKDKNALFLSKQNKRIGVKTVQWLVKKYISTQEIKDVVIGSGIAGIVYKDKIEIINL